MSHSAYNQMQMMESEQPILQRTVSVQSALPLMSENAPLVSYHGPTPDLAWDNADLAWDKSKSRQQQDLQTESIELQQVAEFTSSSTTRADIPSTSPVDNEGYISHPLEGCETL